MDKSQADAIAQAILQPDLEAQEQIRRRRAAEDQAVADRRMVAWFSLSGFVIGAVVAHLTGYRFTDGIIWGGIAGGAVGWAALKLCRRRLAP
ncbi:hypothetical protein AB8807_20050 [Xanthomonas campestris pv. olitorii]|uniref:Uncharacterized protein n=2 Tax=Xanthomonas TaxID=338 RepID=A0AA44YXT2_XANCM|nr:MULTISPECIES: hypothetical protein [Xanthomonas]OOW61739.1 hypothetical protein Xths_17170 [Xanthomonas campestris pv. thespesiae]OOW78797.1 hypothetical protein Xlen_15870 [Xanthomonas campestris pv. leeana]WVK03772.1 hypothetical protein KWH09_20015 [Xanthomonas campestris pv. olitorii]AOL18166.1 hypothetical protein BGK55_01750 [Xanthomonas citri pv. malvacearum]ASN03100.1 hypothetical protein APY29_20535 [Xanthomonas citri pv. malvacearum]